MSEKDARGFTAEQIDGIRAGIRKRESSTDRAGFRGLDRVEITVLEGLEYEARNPHEAGVIRVGEPVDRGGLGEGSSPLSLVIAGAASCLTNQFIRSAVADDVPVRITGADVRGEFSRVMGGGFERITVEIKGEGDLRGEAALAYVRKAEQLCYIHVTLRKAVRMATILTLDGEERARSVTGPDSAEG